MTQVHVRIRVGAETYALPVEHVLEVGELPELGAVPGSGPALLGVLNLRGRVLPTFDLARTFGIPREGRPSPLVVAKEGTRLAGLAVDEVIDVAPLAGAMQESETSYLAGSMLDDGTLVGVIDGHGMFAALEQKVAA
jgi:purine-binding chemotaxis protein CheW